MDSDEIEIDVDVRAETPFAMLVYNGDIEAWLPKSQITDICEERGKIKSIFVREWLAEEKGLI